MNMTHVQEAFGRNYQQAMPHIPEICAADLRRRSERVAEREQMLSEIGGLVADVFYERIDNCLIRRDAVSGADLDALLEKIEQFLGVPQI